MAVTHAPVARPASPPGGGAPRTVPAVFNDRAARYGAREFLHHHTADGWQTLSWADAAERVTRIAAGLVHAGVEPRQAVAIISPNRYEWILCDLAIQSIGGITIPIYPTLTPKTTNYILRDSGAVLVLTAGDELAAKVERGEPVLPIVQLDGEVGRWMATEPPSEARDVVADRLAKLDPEGIATIIYTSGTTGEPKGVIMLQRNFVDMAGPTIAAFPFSDSDVILSYMPYSHVYERMDGLFLPIYAGATIWLARDMTPEHLFEDIATVRPTIMLGVPRTWDRVHDKFLDHFRHGSALNRTLFNWALRVGHRRLAGEDGPVLNLQARLADRFVLRRLRLARFGDRLRCFMSGGGPLNETVEEFYWLIGVKLMQGWGLTETTSAATTNTEAVHRYRTIGKPFPGTEIRIAEDGEILVRGPGVFPGYWNRPEATKETFVDGWFKTGDLGFLDADGFLSITDRKKDLFKTAGGKFIAPLPIEAELEVDRYIKTAVVVGDGKPFAVALIVPDFAAMAADEGITGSPEVVVHDARALALVQRRVDEVNRDLASFETVKYFALLPREFTEVEGELTPTFKIKRRVVAEHFANLIEELYARPKPA